MTLITKQLGSEIFLQNKYFSIGINSDGGLGTQQAAPTQFASDLAAGFQRVGLFADLDGFGTGKATTLHDAVLPGRTIEGFNVGYKINGAKVVQSNQQLTGFSQIKGVVSETSTASNAQASWAGSTADKLAIAQKMSLTDDAKFIRIDVTLTNNSGSAMSDVRYMRTADADQGSTFITENKIVAQGTNGALVASYAGGVNPFFLYSADTRAKVSTYGFVNSDPYNALAYDSAQAQGYSVKADQTVNLTFALGTLAAGQSTTMTLFMGVTDNLDSTIAAINANDTPLSNLAPVALPDAVDTVGMETVTGNVLTNDKDPEGAKLTAALKTGPANGTVTLNSDGTFSYTAKAGFVGVDSFTYAASDGKLSSASTVAITVTAPPPPPKPTPTDVVVIDGSAATSDTLTGVANRNRFFFDIEAKSGADKITNFGSDDLLVTSKALYDGNGDGIIALSKSKLSLDAPKAGDSVTLNGVTALRLLGVDDTGNVLYGDASVRPKGATEGKLGNDVLTGDAANKIKDKFFFDTALDLNFGTDRINNFASTDILVTTTALSAGASGSKITLADGLVKLAGGTGGSSDSFVPGEGGTVELHVIGGALATNLEFDGSASHDGTTYFVYSLAGSSAGVADLVF